MDSPPNARQFEAVDEAIVTVNSRVWWMNLDTHTVPTLYDLTKAWGFNQTLEHDRRFFLFMLRALSESLT